MNPRCWWAGLENPPEDFPSCGGSLHIEGDWAICEVHRLWVEERDRSFDESERG